MAQTTDEARKLARKIRTNPGYKSAVEIVATTPTVAIDWRENIRTLGDIRMMLGQGDYPTVLEIAQQNRANLDAAAAFLEQLAEEVDRLTGIHDAANQPPDEMKAYMEEVFTEARHVRDAFRGLFDKLTKRDNGN